MSIIGESPSVGEIPWRKKKTDGGTDPLTDTVCNALKDHNGDFAKELVANSNVHCKTYIDQYDVDVSDTPCRMTLCNHLYKADVKLMVRSLRADGIPISVAKEILPTTDEPLRLNQRTGVLAAIEAVREAMYNGNHTLFRGQVHSMPKKARFTFIPLESVEDYCQKLLKYPSISHYLANHIEVVVKRLKHPACAIIPQMKINFDLIEVNDGICWQISKRDFIPCPYDQDQIGIISPRMFCEFDSRQPPQPRFFKTSILNSFPDPVAYTRLLNKWYQLLLHEKMLHKVRKLLVYGPIDSGKSTWLEPLRGIIPDCYIASITKEGKFGTSMITVDTQLTFIDEFVPGIIPEWRAKQLFQGGILYNSYKFQNNSNMKNNSPYLITAQDEPNFGNEDASIKRRLYIVKTRPLQQTTSGVEQWLRDNAIHCIVWAGQVINNNREKVEQEELFYEVGNPAMLHQRTEINRDAHYALLEESYSAILPTKRARELFRKEPTRANEAVASSIPSPPPTPPQNEVDFNYSPHPSIISPPRKDKHTIVTSPVVSDTEIMIGNDKYALEDADTAITLPDSTSQGLLNPSDAHDSESDCESSLIMSSFEPLVKSTPVVPSQVDIDQSPSVARISQTPSSLTKIDQQATLCRDIYNLLKSDMNGDADKEHYFAHLQQYGRLRVKPDAQFYAWCYVTGRFKGPLRPNTLYHFYEREEIESHIRRICSKTKIRTLGDNK